MVARVGIGSAVSLVGEEWFFFGGLHVVMIVVVGIVRERVARLLKVEVRANNDNCSHHSDDAVRQRLREVSHTPHFLIYISAVQPFNIPVEE